MMAQGVMEAVQALDRRLTRELTAVPSVKALNRMLDERLASVQLLTGNAEHRMETLEHSARTAKDDALHLTGVIGERVDSAESGATRALREAKEVRIRLDEFLRMQDRNAGDLDGRLEAVQKAQQKLEQCLRSNNLEKLQPLLFGTSQGEPQQGRSTLTPEATEEEKEGMVLEQRERGQGGRYSYGMDRMDRDDREDRDGSHAAWCFNFCWPVPSH